MKQDRAEKREIEEAQHEMDEQDDAVEEEEEEGPAGTMPVPQTKDKKTVEREKGKMLRQFEVLASKFQKGEQLDLAEEKRRRKEMKAARSGKKKIKTLSAKLRLKK